jgi:uncharacterized metal-binding protein
MTSKERRVVIVPCSGIGKPFGTVSREAAYEVCETLRPDETQLVALSKLVLGEEEACRRVDSSPAITIDGCKLMCAASLVKLRAGTIVSEVAVLDVFRRHKDLKPEGIAELNEAGQQLARVVAREIAATIDQVHQAETGGGADHA